VADLPRALGAAGELEQLLAGAGSRAVEIRPVVQTERFASVEAYLLQLEKTAPSTDPVGRLDEPPRRAILADLSTAVRPYLTDDAMVEPMMHVSTVARPPESVPNARPGGPIRRALEAATRSRRRERTGESPSPAWRS
jgi:hypothetical protein